MARQSAETRPTEGVQIPLLEGVAAGVPTKDEVRQAIGIGVTDELYDRLLEAISASHRPWREILEEFRLEDGEADHPWL